MARKIKFHAISSKEKKKNERNEKLFKNKEVERKQTNSNAPQSAPSMAFETGNKVESNTENGPPKKIQQRQQKNTPKLSLSMRRHNKTCVYLLFQYCDCYYGDEGTD